MEVAPSGDQDLCIAAGRVVRQTEVARLVMSSTPISMVAISLTPILLTPMSLTPPARSSLILRAHTQAWHGRPGQREPEWAGDRAAKRWARMRGARAVSLSPPAGDEAATTRTGANTRDAERPGGCISFCIGGSLIPELIR